MHSALCACFCLLEAELVLQPVSGFIVGCSLWPWLNRCAWVYLLSGSLFCLLPCSDPLPHPALRAKMKVYFLLCKVVKRGVLCRWGDGVRGGEPAWELQFLFGNTNCSKLSSLERNYIWQFQCFLCFDAPVCLRGEERAWRRSNWAWVSANASWKVSRKTTKDLWWLLIFCKILEGWVYTLGLKLVVADRWPGHTSAVFTETSPDSDQRVALPMGGGLGQMI